MVDKVRITVDLSNAQFQNLKKLVETTKNSKAQLVRDALNLLQDYITKTSEGYVLRYHHPENPDKIIEIQLLGYETLRK